MRNNIVVISSLCSRAISNRIILPEILGSFPRISERRGSLRCGSFYSWIHLGNLVTDCRAFTDAVYNIFYFPISAVFRPPLFRGPSALALLFPASRPRMKGTTLVAQKNMTWW